MKTVSFSKRTKQLIGNMAKINESLLFVPGQEQITWSAVKGGSGASVFVKAHFVEEIPCEFGIHDLPKFLNILSLYNEDANMAIENGVMIIQGNDNRSYQYMLTPSSSIYSPDVDIELNDIVAEFDISINDLHTLNRTLAVGGLSHVKFMSKKNAIFIVGIVDEESNSSSDIYAVKVGETDKKFNVVFNSTKLQNLMDNDYHVSICDNFVSFKGNDIVYFISPELNSTFK